MAKKSGKKDVAKKLVRNAKKKHEEFAKDGINSFGSKNMRRGTMRRKGKGKKRELTYKDFIKAATIGEAVKPYEPQHAFADFPVEQKLIDNIAQKGYTEPMPIQDQAINPIMEGRDVIGIAQTGTGKTLAFLLPLIDKFQKSQKQKTLIVLPTRELALQVVEELEWLAEGLNIRHALCVGGASANVQKEQLEANPQFIIGTPGRLQDLLQQETLSLAHVNTVVIDEVDRMVDMGFIKELRVLLEHMPKERQSLAFSATLKKEAREVTRKFLLNPVTVAITPRPTSVNVNQDVVFIRPFQDKMEVLHDVLIIPGVEKIMIFVKTKFDTQQVAKELTDRGFNVAALHGDLSQGARKRALKQFKDMEVNILVATDIAARGIDVEDVTHVINYDLPDTYDDYVHRIGRTGRSGKLGVALTFYPKDR